MTSLRALIEGIHEWLFHLWYRIHGPVHHFPDDPAADERAAEADAPTAEPDTPWQ